MNEMSKHFLGAPFREVCCCHSHFEKSLFAPVTNVTVWGVVVAAFPGCGVKGCRLGVARGAPNSAAAARDDLAPAYPTLNM